MTQQVQDQPFALVTPPEVGKPCEVVCQNLLLMFHCLHMLNTLSFPLKLVANAVLHAACMLSQQISTIMQLSAWHAFINIMSCDSNSIEETVMDSLYMVR